MKMACVKLTSAFLGYLFRRDSPNEWRPPYQCENGVERSATFLRAVNEHDGVSLVFGDDSDPRFFKLNEGSEVPAIEVLYTQMGNGAEVIHALKKLRQKAYDRRHRHGSRDEEGTLWDFVAEAFQLDRDPESYFADRNAEGKVFGAAAGDED